MKLTLENLPMYCTPCGYCLLWNQCVNSDGSPLARLGGKPMLVRRYLFTELMGKRLDKKRPVVFPTCHRKLCVEPSHMQAASRGDVVRYSYSSGRRNASTEYFSRVKAHLTSGKAKLNWEKAAEIRARKDEPRMKLAREFGVSRSTIEAIWAGEHWRQALANSSVFAQAASE